MSNLYKPNDEKPQKSNRFPLIIVIILSPVICFAFFSIAVFVDSFLGISHLFNITRMQASAIISIVGILVIVLINIIPSIKDKINLKRATLIDGTVSTRDIQLINTLLKSNWVIIETGFFDNLLYFRLKHKKTNSNILSWNEALNNTRFKKVKNDFLHQPIQSIYWVESIAEPIIEVEQRMYWDDFNDFSKRFPPNSWVLLALDKKSKTYTIGLTQNE